MAIMSNTPKYFKSRSLILPGRAPLYHGLSIESIQGEDGGRGRLLPAYERYFLGALREKFGFHGTPLRLFVRASPGRR
jgi:hypothetical protein